MLSNLLLNLLKLICSWLVLRLENNRLVLFGDCRVDLLYLSDQTLDLLI